MLDSRQAFKAGFLEKCAANGLTREETLAAIQKTAGFLDWLKTIAKGVGTGAGALWSGAAKPLMWGAIGAPPAIGAAVGYGLGSSDVDEDDIEDAKKREQIDEYKRQAERLLAKNRLRTY